MTNIKKPFQRSLFLVMSGALSLGAVGCASQDTASVSEAVTAKDYSKVAPGTRFDLTHWKLTLPTDANGDGKVDGIKTSGLQNYINDDFFYLDELGHICLLYTSPSPRDQRGSRMPSSA